nr:hypothetical protein [Novosphingobium sp. Gsoil 351]
MAPLANYQPTVTCNLVATRNSRQIDAKRSREFSLRRNTISGRQVTTPDGFCERIRDSLIFGSG